MAEAQSSFRKELAEALSLQIAMDREGRIFKPSTVSSQFDCVSWKLTAHTILEPHCQPSHHAV